MKLNYVKGFTIAEMLITLVLTSASITLSYHTLSYVQKLFYSYKEQNQFLQQYTHLKRVLDDECLKSDKLIEENENEFSFYNDTLITQFKISESLLILKKGLRTDSVKTKALHIQKTYENFNNPNFKNKFINSLSFEVLYTKQKFNFYIYKNYDASVKMELEKQE